MNKNELDFMKNHYKYKISKGEFDCLVIFNSLTEIPYESLKEICDLPYFSFQYLSSFIGNELMKCSILYYEFFEDVKKLVHETLNILIQNEKEISADKYKLIFDTSREYHLLHDKFYQIVEIEEGIEKIIDNLFHDSEIKKIIIPESLKEIGQKAFYQCKLLEIVIIKSTILEKIGISAFSGCEKLPFISIPDQVKAIEESAFDSCSSLKNINLPNGLVEIKRNAFYECSSLTMIELPKTITNIGIGAFSNCYHLEQVKIVVTEGSKLTFEDSCFQNCKKLKEVIFVNPELFTENSFVMKDKVFKDCENLKYFNFPSCKNIGKSCFKNCKSLESVTLPQNLQW